MVNRHSLLALLIVLLACPPLYANIVWPAIYVSNSYFRFWYIVAAGTVVEALALARIIKIPVKKACLLSVAANLFSATVGLWLLTIGMLGWHLIADAVLNGTFHPFNKAVTIGIMFVGSVLLEAALCRLVWKYKFRVTIPALLLGNLVSYAFVVVDLYYWGGWRQTF